MVFLAKAATSNEWKVVAATISTLVEEASFEATVEGLAFRAMDPSHVALIDLVWPNSAFEKYNCEKQLKFTVRVGDFVKLIRRADSKDSIEVSVGDDESLVLKISNGYRRQFKMHLIDSTYGPTPVPKLDFKAKLNLAEPAFEKILNDISTVSDHVTIEISKEKVTFSGKSDAGSAAVDLEKSHQDVLEFEVKEDSKATYSLEYLLNIVKGAGSASDAIKCEFSSKMPIKLEFKLSDIGGKIDFYLAPRIEER